MTHDEFLALFEKVKNWGRWGAADERGTLNFTGSATIRAAASQIRDGVVVSLARPISTHTDLPGVAPPVHFMARVGSEVSKSGQDGVSDWLGMGLHGPANTHLDSFAHQTWDGAIYGGRPASEAISSAGALYGSIERAAPGVLSRGILLDVPRSEGVPWIDPAVGIVPAQLDRCAAAEGVEIRSGDVVFVRTGRDRRAADEGPRREHSGLDPAAVTWCYEHEVSVLGSDVDSDVRPSPYDFAGSPIHGLTLVAMGLWLIDNAYLESLVDECVARSRWEFACVLAPLLIEGGTSSPMNPLAVF